MKVMILSSYAPSLFIFREDMMKAMIDNGHEVIAVAPEPLDKWHKKFKDKGIKYISISGIERTGMNPLKDIVGFFSILKVIRNEKPDKIFVYQAKTVIYGSIAAKIAKIKNVYAMMGGLGSVFRNKKKRSISKSILKLEYKIAFKFCNKVFFQNSDDYKLMLDNKIVSSEQVTMVNGSGVNMRNFKEELIINFPVFLFVGRIIKDKGIIEYINASKIVKEKYPEAKMQIVGYFDTNPSAIKKDEIQEFIDNGIVEYLGPTDDVRPFLKECSIFVLPSYHEGTPKSILEAMATGRPIITTDAPGCRETVQEGVNGFLVKVGDYLKLAEKMIWMIENRNYIDKMANESLRICQEKFDVEKVNDIILKTMDL